MAIDSVWIVLRDSIPSNPVVGVFATRDDATDYVDGVLVEHPDEVFEIGEFRIGVPLY